MPLTISLLTTFALALICALAAACAPTQPLAKPPSHQTSKVGPRADTTPAEPSKPMGSDTYTVDFIGADLCAAPSASSAHLTVIPEGTVLVPLARESYFIRVNYAGQTGWVSTAGLERHMAVPAPELDFNQSGYKLIDGEYRYFFRFTNRGVQPYTGNINVRLYAGDAEVPLGGIGAIGEPSQAYARNDESDGGYPVHPGDEIALGQSRAFYLVAAVPATRYVFETAQGKKTGSIGERLAN